MVQVRDFPFLPHLLTGRFSTIDVAATDASARGINAAQLQLTLHGVRVPREVLLGERPGHRRPGRRDHRADRGRGQPAAGRPPPGRELAIGEDGVEVRTQVELLGQPLDVQVSGKLGARDGGVTFTPDEIRLGDRGPLDPSADFLSSQFTFQVPLPELPAGVRLERVDTRPGTVVLRGRAASVGVAA